ncbi:hypothetical protein SDC9_208882 [bioreactor metagenome]|uniref:SOS response-associated peptidase YedK n=1 Tax=bioreactor metagenome TaxID=1076179 RepID=A0A645JBT4_9ZZZZ
MAGLYSLAEGAARFAVVTRPAFFEAAAVHPRMPALLSRDTVDAWIFGELGLEPLVTGPAKALCFALDGPSFPAK